MKILKFILILIVFASCKKVSTPPSKNASVANATEITTLKEWYSAKKKDKSNYHHKKVKAIPIPIPQWELTKYYQDKKVYVTPVLYPNTDVNPTQALLTYKNDNNEIVNAEFSFILLNDEPGNIIVSNVGNYYPDILYFENLPSQFQGSILKYNINGEYLSSQHYKDGQIKNTFEGIDFVERAPNVSPENQPIVCIDHWWVTYYDDGTIITIDYLGSSCYEPNPIEGSDGGANGSDSHPDENLNADAAICEKSFKFKTYIQTSNGFGGWQIAGTTNIHMNIIDFITEQVKPLYLPTIYFGLPVIRQNGEFYSAEYASTLSANAVEYAEKAVMDYYHSIGGSLNAPAMTLYYRRKINEYMEIYAGSATLTPGTNLNITQITQASYGWPIIGCL